MVTSGQTVIGISLYRLAMRKYGALPRLFHILIKLFRNVNRFNFAQTVGGLLI
jgi:hypothetical protein